MPADQPQSSHPSSHSETSPSADDDWNTPDPLWNLLDNASKTKENVFFVRNLVRETRFLKQDRANLLVRLASLLTVPRIALGSIACGVAILTAQLFVPSTAPQKDTAHLAEAHPAPEAQVINTSNETHLSKIVMHDTLSAAAEDLSIFTHEEVLVMLDL